ncbi:GNAT family N-acetyltransferase [Viridibacillus arvi]|uniref:GNAT family N-acetyltransferase n=1 Tax=Viridibacillus arvi TaxID=263475 RepID=UPI003D2D8F11
MNEEEYAKYISDKINRYSQVLSRNNFEKEHDNYYEKSKNIIQNYLPNGFKTYNHYFYHIKDNGKIIGYVWLKIEKEKESAFLYEIFLFEAVRSKGYGKKIMIDIERLLADKHIKIFKLHVFGSNEHAINLYKSLDFSVAGINMYKNISEQ